LRTRRMQAWIALREQTHRPARGVVDERVDAHLWGRAAGRKARSDPHFDRQPERIPLLVLWRDQDSRRRQSNFYRDRSARTRGCTAPGSSAIKDYECLVPAKYKRRNIAASFCEKCLRRKSRSQRFGEDRMGQSSWPRRSPIFWFLKSCCPSRTRTVLDMTMKDLERISTSRTRRTRAWDHFAGRSIRCSRKKNYLKAQDRLRRRPVHRVDWREALARCWPPSISTRRKQDFAQRVAAKPLRRRGAKELVKD